MKVIKFFRSYNRKETKVRGVYIIKCTTNNIVYIGSSKYIQRRIYNHFGKLRRNQHGNPHLQNIFNKYGINKFKVYYIPIYSEQLLFREEQMINKLPHNCNIDKTPTLGLAGERTKERSERWKKSRIKSGYKRPNKPFAQYDVSGNFIKLWLNGQKECAKELKLSSSKLSGALNYKENKTYKDFIFRFVDINNYPKQITNIIKTSWGGHNFTGRTSPNVKPIYQYTLNNVLVKIWLDGIPDIEKNFNRSKSAIGHNLIGLSQTCGGFIFSYDKLNS